MGTAGMKTLIRLMKEFDNWYDGNITKDLPYIPIGLSEALEEARAVISIYEYRKDKKEVG